LPCIKDDFGVESPVMFVHYFFFIKHDAFTRKGWIEHYFTCKCCDKIRELGAWQKLIEPYLTNQDSICVEEVISNSRWFLIHACIPPVSHKFIHVRARKQQWCAKNSEALQQWRYPLTTDSTASSAPPISFPMHNPATLGISEHADQQK
jgi:hypothetical protein